MNKTFIVAECGVNHSGNIETAKQLIQYAKWAGADAVKFQMWHPETFPKLIHLRFLNNHFEYLFKYCGDIGIKWFCTPFDIWSVNFLADFGMNIWKIPSNRIVLDNKEMLEAIAKIVQRVDKTQLIISTGLFDDFNDIYKLIDIFKQHSFNAPMFDTSILHCVSKYPTSPKESNLWQMQRLMEIFTGYKIGLSDHSTTISIPVAAVALGASVIEKHITLDRNLDGPDHKASIIPNEFKEMTKGIREVERALA